MIMARYVIVAFVCCLYTAGSVLLVQTTGHAYRESLRRARKTAAPISEFATERPTRSPEITAVDHGAKPEPTEPEMPPAKLSLERQPSDGATPRESPGLSPPPPAAVVSQPQSSLSSGPAKVSIPGTNPPPVIGVNPDRKLDLFWSQDFLTKKWDVDRLAPQDEIVLGEQLHDLILKSSPPDDESVQRLKKAAERLRELDSSKGAKYEFTVLNSEIPNAFSHPGGFIYISRKLLDMIAEEEDYVLEFVIGHEMAHLELHHALQVLRNAGVRNIPLGTLQKLYFLIIPHAYPDEFELAADAWVYQRMKRLNRSDHDCLAFLRKLERYAKANGFEAGRGKIETLMKGGSPKPDSASIVSPIDNHLRAHNAASERLDHLRKLRDQAAGATK
jgi:hypothetical protein